MATWQIQDAKTRLRQLIERARAEGPQTITRHAKERAVVLAIEDYCALAAHLSDFKSYLLDGAKVDDFTIERDRDAGRTVKALSERPRLGVSPKYQPRQVPKSLTE